MYICEDCGATFDEARVYEYTESEGERWCDAYCPECGSQDFVEAEECEICGEYHDPRNLHWGVYCTACVLENIDYDRFYQFATEGAADDKPDTLEDFLFSKFFGLPADDVPKGSSVELKIYMRSLYHMLVTNERESGGDRLITLVHEYVQNTGMLINDYAEWLEGVITNAK